MLLSSRKSQGFQELCVGDWCQRPNISRNQGFPGASLVAQLLKNLPALQETWVPLLSPEDPLEEEMVTHSGILAWKIPWTEEPGGLPSMGLQRVGHDWASFTFRDRNQHTYFLSFYSDEFFKWILYQRNEKNYDFLKRNVYLLLAVLGLHCFVQAFSSCEQGPLFVAVLGLLTVVASWVAERGL